MIALVLAMLVCVALGGLVVGFVAVEARRDGRDVLTPEGEELLAGARRRQEALRDRGEKAARRTLQNVRK
ncbi:hypothetical protein [Ornithinimicrobium cavernae]|uniref:hypothetical protein n=1 Tax=Ornithinimicrobium cavernae TaxID=2666047 RepID=UPI0012B16C44|nr:hypothetical protein [Ornithinimicrobium cavernae]